MMTVAMVDVECEKCEMISHYEFEKIKSVEKCPWCGHENKTGFEDVEENK